MAKRPSMLLVTNETSPGTSAPGVHDAFNWLTDEGVLSEVSGHSWKPQVNESESERAERLIEIFSDKRYDLALVTSPREITADSQTLDRILAGLAGRPMALWEGDAIALWPIGKTMARWFENSTVTFSQCGEPQVQKLLELGCREVRFIPASYCHLQFHALESMEPPPTSAIDVAMIANETLSWRNLFGNSGARKRRLLAKRLYSSHHSFELRGKGWPRSWTAIPIPFEDQGDVIRRARLSVNWDNTPDYADTSSNRLPISLIAGRPHVTTLHPGMDWLPSDSIGLFEEPDVSSMLERIEELLRLPQEETYAMGLEAHRWVRHRLSHREAMRYMLEVLGVDKVPPLPSEPWDHLPGPWLRSQ